MNQPNSTQPLTKPKFNTDKLTNKVLAISLVVMAILYTKVSTEYKMYKELSGKCKAEVVKQDSLSTLPMLPVITDNRKVK